MAVVIAIDAGTTGVRSVAVHEDGSVVGSAYRELPQHFPAPGLVEHDPDDIWAAAAETLAALAARLDGEAVAAIGIANQRETAVVWDRRTGRPRHRALVWQDRRTARRCRELVGAGHLDLVRRTTGLVLDPYFSATKLEWLLAEGGVAADSALAFGTVDTWLLWNLTGGIDGGVHATEASNASRTLLLDIHDLSWSADLVDLFGVPASCLPEVRPSAGRFGTTAPGTPLPGVPVTGVLGDQQAALLGQACVRPGMTKATYGTGSFVLMNVGGTCPAPVEGLLGTVAWTGLGTGPTYALEGAIFVTGALVQWLRDGLGIIPDSAAMGPLAASVPDSGGVAFVPALTGLGSPWWDPDARGTVVGITRGTTAAHLARAGLEAMAFQTRDVADAMTSAAGRPVAELRVDGGASAMDLLVQVQADQLGVPVARSGQHEATALGAAALAGLAAGVWSSPDEVAARWRPDLRCRPLAPRSEADAHHRRWRAAVDRARGWAAGQPTP
ncbi:MAG TPA: glycerol kinase GlpK [Acidimicrobiales bacterium]|nr:glycerol kinase GlpK [Acidimicrobiales bacterium]